MCCSQPDLSLLFRGTVGLGHLKNSSGNKVLTACEWHSDLCSLQPRFITVGIPYVNQVIWLQGLETSEGKACVLPILVASSLVQVTLTFIWGY